MKKQTSTEIELDRLYPQFKDYVRVERGYFAWASLSDRNVFVDWLHTEGFVIARPIVSTDIKHRQ